MNIKLVKTEQGYLLMIGDETLIFDTWLQARVTMDHIDESKNVWSIVDTTGQAVLHGYAPTKGVDV